jgi:glycosyltransferase involved in cell wall biosynthesis
MSIKVAHVTLSMGTGGIEKLILDLCKYSDKANFNVSVICLDSPGDLYNELEPNGIAGLVEQRKPGFDFSLIKRLIHLFKEKKIDVVHSHNQACAFYAGIAAFMARVPVSVVTEHSRNYINNNLTRMTEKYIISMLSSKWVNVSKELALYTIKLDNVNNNKVKVIVNGVDCIKCLNPDQNIVNRIRQENNLSKDNKIIVMVARLDKIKNHDLMIDSLNLLVKDIKETRLLIVGDGECRNDLNNKVHQLGLSKEVIFLGLSKNIPEILALSDVFVLCSHSEGLPLSLLEASAAKVPVVITENSNGAQFIKNMEKGIVVKDDAISLAAGIKECFKNYDQALKMSSNAHIDVVNNYSLKNTVKEYENLYFELLKRKRNLCV